MQSLVGDFFVDLDYQKADLEDIPQTLQDKMFTEWSARSLAEKYIKTLCMVYSAAEKEIRALPTWTREQTVNLLFTDTPPPELSPALRVLQTFWEFSNSRNPVNFRLIHQPNTLLDKFFSYARKFDEQDKISTIEFLNVHDCNSFTGQKWAKDLSQNPFIISLHPYLGTKDEFDSRLVRTQFYMVNFYFNMLFVAPGIGRIKDAKFETNFKDPIGQWMKQMKPYFAFMKAAEKFR